MKEHSSAAETTQLQLAPGTIRVEVMRDSKWSIAIIALLLVCGGVLCVAWRALERSTTRILYPEMNLSVLELEASVIKFDGIDGHFDLRKLQLVDPSKIGISFSGSARLGVDLSRAKFEFDRLRSRLYITLPEPKVTDVDIETAHIWERKTNKADSKELDRLECKLCNEALSDFREVAKEPYYGDEANRLAKAVLRNYYKRNHPWLDVKFK